MADPTAITGIVLACAAAVTAATPIVIARRRGIADRAADAREQAASSVVTWSTLNDSLGREITRLQASIDSQAARSDARLARQQQEYEARLNSADARIAELMEEIAILNRLAGRPPG